MDTSHDLQATAAPDLGLSAPPASPDVQAEPALPTPPTPPAAEPLVVLSPAQRQAWDRLNQPDATVTDAAAFAGVSRTQFYRWVDTDPTFRALYTAWLEQQQRAGEGLLFAGEAVSAEVIFEAVRDRRDL